MDTLRLRSVQAMEHPIIIFAMGFKLVMDVSLSYLFAIISFSDGGTKTSLRSAFLSPL